MGSFLREVMESFGCSVSIHTWDVVVFWSYHFIIHDYYVIFTACPFKVHFMIMTRSKHNSGFDLDPEFSRLSRLTEHLLQYSTTYIWIHCVQILTTQVTKVLKYLLLCADNQPQLTNYKKKRKEEEVRSFKSV